MKAAQTTKEKNTVYTVITADLVHSRMMPPKEREDFFKLLKAQLKLLSVRYKFTYNIYRGDSFQAIIPHPYKGLLIALAIRYYVRTLKMVTYSKQADIRIALGIGLVDFLKKKPEYSDGPAFHYSGTRLDELDKGKIYLGIRTHNESINDELHISCALLDQLIQKTTINGASVLYYKVLGYKEQTIAKKLKISQSAVNQRSRDAGWSVVQLFIERYNNFKFK